MNDPTRQLPAAPPHDCEPAPNAPFRLLHLDRRTTEFTESDYLPRELNVGGICVCLQGNSRVTFNQHRCRIQKGDMCVFFPHMLLQLDNQSDDFEAYCIVSEIDITREVQVPSATSLFLYIKDNPCISLTNEQVEDILQYSRILNKYDRMDDMPFHKHIIEHSVMSLSYIVASIYARHAPIKQMPLTRQNTILHKFLSTLATDFTRSREVAYYADKLCITPKYLTIVVRNTSGMSATEWISRIVINNAKALLTGTQMTVQQISNKLNFPNPSFFGQYFLRHVGKTPKEYRRDSINML